MTMSWSYARSLWLEHFSKAIGSGFSLERVDQDEYWKIHEQVLRDYFQPEAMISLCGLRSEHETAGQKRLAQTRADDPLQDFCIVYNQDKVAASFCGEQKDSSTYRMWHSNIHPGFRRRGLYRGILDATIAYTAALGFDTIESEHAPGNNPVLIAKLSSGFRIVGMSVEPMGGTSVVLRYFHNPDHLAAYEYRCGLATMNPRLLAHGFGAMAKLTKQFSSAP